MRPLYDRYRLVKKFLAKIKQGGALSATTDSKCWAAAPITPLCRMTCCTSYFLNREIVYAQTMACPPLEIFFHVCCIDLNNYDGFRSGSDYRNPSICHPPSTWPHTVTTTGKELWYT